LVFEFFQRCTQSPEEPVKLNALSNLPCLYYYFHSSNFDFVELCASLTKEDNYETKRAIAVGLHELVSVAEGAEKDPFEFTETIINILEDDHAWLCLVPGLDVLLTSLVKYFK